MNDKILIVEDDKGIVKHLTELLIEEGYVVEAVGTKQEALLKAETGGFSLVLIDLTLPDGNGYTVCTVFRQQ
ncbi:MAG: response regulator, partial [Lachnospiraceae bacterium]|nr:response regulator [Lachnospiraceae bacterium]